MQCVVDSRHSSYYTEKRDVNESDILNIVRTLPTFRERISEEMHWAFETGALELPWEERTLILSHKKDIQSLLSFLCRMYIHLIGKGRVRDAAGIMRLFPQIEDPYMPEICKHLAIDHDICRADPFIDKAIR